MNGKSETGGKGRTSGNIPLWIGPSDSGTGYLQKFLGLNPVNQTLLERGLEKWPMWWTEGNGSVLKIIWKGSEVKLSLEKWRCENPGILLRVYMGMEEKKSGRHVKIGVQYLWRNSFINYVQYSLSSPCFAFPMCIVGNCSWSCVYCVIA